MATYKNIATFQPKSRADWRRWLAKNHERQQNVWLILYHKGSGKAGLSRGDAVEEALCFGWIDSVANKRDDESFYQFYSKRKPKSIWSKVNKKLVSRLTKEGLMQPSGQKMVTLAKKTGTWNALKEIDNLTIPPDLETALKATPSAFEHFENFSNSSKKIILYWITTAKTSETRSKRIAETVQKAAINVRANQYAKKKGEI
jgi:uncharacterized protein YdeI (YjbR/CyaY-like superfamily)